MALHSSQSFAETFKVTFILQFHEWKYFCWNSALCLHTVESLLFLLGPKCKNKVSLRNLFTQYNTICHYTEKKTWYIVASFNLTTLTTSILMSIVIYPLHIQFLIHNSHSLHYNFNSNPFLLTGLPAFDWIKLSMNLFI